MYTAKDIIKNIKNPTNADKRLIITAYDFAVNAHTGHKRYSGQPYMEHLANVSYKLSDLGMDAHTIAAGLLHDTIEDTSVTSDDIKKEFGEEILFLVEGVTKLSSVRYHGTDRHNESLRKLFVATSQDIRTLIIKLTDRLHNMETLNFVPKEKQLRIAKETLEIHVPVAHRLGMNKIREQLENLAFPYVYPTDYLKVKKILAKNFNSTQKKLEKERKIIQKKLFESKIKDFNTSFRVKGIYSLYNKLKNKDWNINRVYDLLAMRIIVNSIEDCYLVLGIVHELWRPLPNRVKDYIAFPKPNGYQSLHTTVTTKSGMILEVQIRTKKMHENAEFGVASHLLYKQPVVSDKANLAKSFFKLIPNLLNTFTFKSTPSNNIDSSIKLPHHEKIPSWIAEIGENYNDSTKYNSSDFASDASSDFFSSRIFVFTPIGDVVDLPYDATIIDFAYAIHSEVGNHAFGAQVNHKQVPLQTKLKNGDMVEISTRKHAKPGIKWLDFVKTSLARRHIKNFLEENKK